MTDDQMDDRLRRAGAAWRATEAIPAAAPAADEIGEVHEFVPPRRSRTHRALALASAAIVAAGLVAGGVFVHHLTQDGSNDTAPVALQGTVWQLRGYGSQDDANSSATFYIGGSGHLVADDTCEVIGGSADIGSATLSVTKQIVRYRSCTDSVGETTFTRGLSLLRGRSTYSLDGEHLTITRAGATPMHFDASPGTPAPTLDVPTFTGASWRLVSVKDSSGTTTVTTDIGFRVTDDGRFTADTGCGHRSTGRVTQGGSGATFHLDGPLQVSCSIAGRVQAILQGQVTQAVDRGTLTLSKKGAGTLTYRWVPQQSPATAPASLTGTDWQLSLAAGAASISDASLYIDKTGKLTGSDGCRQLRGHADVQAGTMTITGVPTARSKSCKHADQATTIDSLLTGDVLWSVRDGRLVINGGGAQAFALVYVEPGAGTSSSTTDPKALKYTTWQLIATAMGNGPLQPVPASIEARLGFVNKDKIDFDDGVNQNEGLVTIGSGTLKIGSTAGTLVGCAGSCEPAGVIDRVLTGSPHWFIDGDKLTLSKSGVGILVYISTNSRKAASAAPASSTNHAASATDLRGNTWRLTEIDHTTGNRGSSQSAVAAVNLDFAAQEVVVEETCSKITYAAGTTDATIEFGRVLHREVIRCPRQNAGVNQDVNTANALLRGTVRWQLNGSQLTLTKGGTSLVFSS